MKRWWWILAGGAVLAIVYYFFIIPYEFRVRFKARTVPGDIIQTIRLWNKSLNDSRIERIDSIERLVQTVKWNDGVYKLTWEFEMVNDSVTSVVIEMSEPERRLLNKLLVPFKEQSIELDANEMGRQFYDVLKTHLAITRVNVRGKAQIPSSFCVCRSIETPQTLKANGMMNEFSFITSFIHDHNLTPDGFPMVRVSRWDHAEGKLMFDFCFPIKRNDSLPNVKDLHYRNFDETPALHAEFRGNYITSDRAWYELLHYASENGYEVAALPVERFHDNPNLGINEKEWLADVYLPLLTN